MYEVYALKYGERDTNTCQFFYRDEEHAPLTLHYFVWLILGGPHPVLVDTGFLEDDAEKRGIRNFYRNVETGQPTQIITSLPEMLAGFDRVHELAGKEKLIVAGHDPLVADRFKQVEPGIIKIA